MERYRYIYNFGNGRADGNASMKEILGGKGANLAEMTNIKLPVPPGFTISTEVCEYYYKNNKQLPKSIKSEVNNSIEILEKNKRPVSAVADNLEIRDIESVKITEDRKTELFMLFDPETNLEEKILEEQFTYS